MMQLERALVMAEANQPAPREVAEYVRDLAFELAALARGAGLASVAGGLEQAYRAADAELRALQSPKGNAAPDDAA
jgi:hypothetical protein